MHPDVRHHIAGLILAGGRSSRMGFNKAFLPLAGRPMIAHVIERLLPQVKRLAINAATDDRYDPFPCDIVPDRIGNQPGPLAGLSTGLAWAREQKALWLATAPCDAPFVPVDLVERLAVFCNANLPILAESPDSLEPMFGLWPVTALEAVDEALRRGDRGMKPLATRLGMQRVAIPARGSEEWWTNINTPADAEIASRHHGWS